MFDKLEKDFCNRVEKYAINNRCTYLEAITDVCEEMEIEPVLAAKYISKPIKEKLRVEFEQKNFLPKTPKLW